MAPKSQQAPNRPSQPTSAPAPKEAPRPSAAAPSNVDEQRLRELTEKVAYELYEKRGRTPGNHEADWYEAEKIARQRLAEGKA